MEEILGGSMCRMKHSCTKQLWSQRCLGGSIARKDKFPTESIVFDYAWHPRNAKVMYFLRFFIAFGRLEIRKWYTSLRLATSKFENVVFPCVWQPRDSKMLYFLTFGSLEIWKCCISARLDASRFENVVFPSVWPPRDLKMLHFLTFGNLEIRKCFIS